MYAKVGTEEYGPADAFHWAKPEIRGTPPTKRNEHTCVAVDSLIFMFGGFAESGTLNDLHIYDTSVNSWTKANTTGNGPSTRYGNSLVLIGRKIYLFGGMVGGNTFAFGDIPDGIFARMFHIKSEVEAIEEPENDTFTLDVDTLVWEELIVKGTIPKKRCGHGGWHVPAKESESASSFASPRMMIFGGWGENAVRLNDTFQFDLGLQSWSEVSVLGRKPSPRCGFSISCVGDSVFLFGGWGQDGRALGDFHVLNLANMHWSPLKLKGAFPPGRTGHSAVVVTDKVYIFGGDAADTFYNDIHILDTDKLVWTKPESSGNRPAGISRHCACLVGADMFVIGGWDRNFFYNDVWYVRTELAGHKELRHTWAFKAVIVGDSGVGKTCLIKRLADDVFSEDTTSTIGIDYRVIPIEVENDDVKLQLWDTAGQERFQTITSSYYRGSHGIILVYDITSQESFDHLYRWVKDIEKTMGKEEFVGLVIGNKSDLALKRQVDTNIGKRFALDHNFLFVETSAKDAVEVDRAFSMLCGEVIDNAREHHNFDEEPLGPRGISLAGITHSSKNSIANIQDRFSAFSTNRGANTNRSGGGGCCGGKDRVADEF